MLNTELTFQESIDKAIEILQELRNQENNDGAFILTAEQNDPTDPSVVLVSCVSNGPIANQIDGLLQYVDSDPRIMIALDNYYESH